MLRIAPLVVGGGLVSWRARSREVAVFGANSALKDIQRWEMAAGRFLPNDELERARPVAVLGSTVAEELYGADNPLGQRVRVGGERYRVAGIMESKGEMLGIDLDDSVYIPAARGRDMFNRTGLHEIDVLYAEDAPADEVVAGIRRILVARHGAEDFTILTQQQMLDVLGSIIDVPTLGVGALGGISLLVGGVGIFTIMTIAVRKRNSEIGLLRAIGTTRATVSRMFVAEAVLLAGFGGIGGLLVALLIIALSGVFAPGIPVDVSVPYVLLAEFIALLTGLAAGVLPAYRAATLVPLDALRADQPLAMAQTRCGLPLKPLRDLLHLLGALHDKELLDRDAFPIAGEKVSATYSRQRIRPASASSGEDAWPVEDTEIIPTGARNLQNESSFINEECPSEIRHWPGVNSTDVETDRFDTADFGQLRKAVFVSIGDQRRLGVRRRRRAFLRVGTLRGYGTCEKEQKKTAGETI
ncbi:MAG: ABC transporter permease [Gammaproteobacteria bacterium]